MSVAKQIVYLKGEQLVEVDTLKVTLGDIVSLECADSCISAKLKSLKIFQIFPEKSCRYVVSILKIIEVIHEKHPELEVQNLGAPDIIVTYENQHTPNKIFHVIKIILIALIVFVGAAFSIITFNNDVGVPKVFSQIYELFMGVPKKGFTILELSYSIGLAIGILVFFNHFGKKRLSVDPTPLEVEMRLYENDIQTTLIQAYSRKEQELDVDQRSSTSNRRV